MCDYKIDFLYLNEKDMIEAGVLEAGRCVDVMGEVMSLLSRGDFIWQEKNGTAQMAVMQQRGCPVPS